MCFQPAVYPNESCEIVLGPNLLGSPKSRLSRRAWWSFPLSFIIVIMFTYISPTYTRSQSPSARLRQKTLGTLRASQVDEMKLGSHIVVLNASVSEIALQAVPLFQDERKDGMRPGNCRWHLPKISIQSHHPTTQRWVNMCTWLVGECNLLPKTFSYIINIQWIRQAIAGEPNLARTTASTAG